MAISRVKSQWHHFLSALQFLTIIPLKTNHAFDANAALPFFPICGLCIGACLVAADALAALFWPHAVVATVDLITLAILSGALHLDGVADTADGLYGQRTPERALSIMKDSRIGAMGTVAVLCCLLAKWTGLNAIEGTSKLWLLLVPAYTRAAVLIGIKFLPYGRSGTGTGRDFFQKPLTPAAFWGLGFLLLISLLMGWDAMKINLGFITIVVLTLLWYRRKLAVITGDMLGALIEFTEAGLFIMAATRWTLT